MNQIRKNSCTNLSLVTANLGEAVLTACPENSGTRGSNFFELLSRDFHFMSQNSGMLLSKPIFKTAPTWSKTTFFCGLKTRTK
jgi:hypothetical protein